MARLSDYIAVATIVAGAVAAAAIDVRTRRVPNALNALLASIGLVLAVTGLSAVSVGAAALGLGVGLALMLPGFIFGAMGAGDVKLFAAMGTLVGPMHIVRAFVFTAIAGGLHAPRIRELPCFLEDAVENTIDRLLRHRESLQQQQVTLGGEFGRVAHGQ